MAKAVAEKTVSVNVRGVPALLRDEFKAVCARGGVTVRDAIVMFMEEAVKDARNEARRSTPGA